MTITVDDGNGGTDSKTVTIIVNNDLDEDENPDFSDLDDDNDGVDDVEDHLQGNSENVISNIPLLNLSINGETNLSPSYSDIQEVIFMEESDPLVVFNFDFSNTLNLGDIILQQNEDATTGSLVIKGLTLPEGQTKTVYVDKLKAESNSVCVIDEEISSDTEMSLDCSKVNEIKLNCPGTSGGYTCLVEESNFKISGLQHSGAKEFYIAPPPPAPLPASSLEPPPPPPPLGFVEFVPALQLFPFLP